MIIFISDQKIKWLFAILIIFLSGILTLPILFPKLAGEDRFIVSLKNIRISLEEMEHNLSLLDQKIDKLSTKCYTTDLPGKL